MLIVSTTLGFTACSKSNNQIMIDICTLDSCEESLSSANNIYQDTQYSDEECLYGFFKEWKHFDYVCGEIERSYLLCLSNLDCSMYHNDEKVEEYCGEEQSLFFECEDLNSPYHPIEQE